MQGNIRPRLFLKVSPSTADELKTGQIPMFQTIIFVQNTVWANSIRGETVYELEKGENNTGQKYTVPPRADSCGDMMGY